MSRYLLETTTCSRLMQNEPTVKRHLDSLTDSDYPFTIPIVHGEILYGIERLPKGKRQRDISQRANRLFSEIQCDPIPKETATHYAKLKRQAEEQGTSRKSEGVIIQYDVLPDFGEIKPKQERETLRKHLLSPTNS